MIFRCQCYQRIAAVLFTWLLAWPSGQARAERLLALAGDLGLGGYGGSLMSTLQTGLDIREGNLALGFFGRVRFVFDGDDERLVRSRDYDEVSDYVHIVRYLRYYRRFGKTAVEIHGGEILGYTLGHGTLLRDYSNIADPDHLHCGFRVAIEHPRWEVDALLDNLVRPSVVGGRLGVRPFESLKGLTVAASLLFDPRAPRRVRLDHAGMRAVDEAANLQTEDELLTLMGLDIEWRFGDRYRGQVVPYADFNSSFRGVGLHVGTLGYLPVGDSGLELSGQLEYRLTGGGYAPSPFSTFYDVERFQSSLNYAQSLSESPAFDTQLANVERGVFGGHGFLGQVGLSMDPAFSFKLGFRHHPGPDANRLWLRAASTPWLPLTLGAMVLFRGLGGKGFGSGVAAVAEARYRINDYLYALTQFSRTWALDAGSRFYEPVHSFNVAFGGTWSD